MSSLELILYSISIKWHKEFVDEIKKRKTVITDVYPFALQRTRAGTYRTVRKSAIGLKQVTLKHDPRIEVTTALVGIITDSEEVTTIEGLNLADEIGIHYCETKPTDSETIKGIFQDLTRKVLSKK
jgi:hypothetical protein